MSAGSTPDDDQVSEDTMRRARQAMEDAARIPGGTDLADLLAAYRERAGATPEQAREVSGRVVSQVQEMTFLLGQLAALTGGR